MIDRGPANRERDHIAGCRRAGEGHRGVRVGRADAPPLVVPEDAHVDIGVALEAELLELPEVPGRGLLVAVVGVEVDGERHVRIDLRRVRNVLRHQRPQVIEIEVVPGAGGVLLVRAVISTVWVPAATPPRTFTFAVVPPYSFRYRSNGDPATATPSTVTADLAAIGVQERPEIEIVLRRLRVPERHLPDVQRARWARCAWRGRCSTTATASRRAVFVGLPGARVRAARIRLLDPRRAAADLQAAVAGDLRYSRSCIPTPRRSRTR